MENLFIPNIPFVTDIFVGNTAFRQAIVDNNLEVVKDMLDKEIVKVEDKYMMHMRAIHYACQYGRKTIVEELLKRGADVNAKDSYIGYTPLHWAAEGGFVSIVELLVDKYEAKVDEKDGINSTFSDTHSHSTAMHLACAYGKTSTALALLARGANPNLVDIEGRTPLMLSCYYELLDTAADLILKGVDVNIKDKQGLSPILWCVTNGHNHLLSKIIFVGGADYNQKNNDGETLLHIAIRNGFTRMALLLMEADGIDLNVTTKAYNCTALHLACYYNQIDLAIKLTELGADMTIKDTYDGKTAVAYCQEEETRKMLIDKNPNKDTQRVEDVDVDVFRASIND